MDLSSLGASWCLGKSERSGWSHLLILGQSPLEILDFPSETLSVVSGEFDLSVFGVEGAFERAEMFCRRQQESKRGVRARSV